MVKIGRNDPCPCGSGKKYKKCCIDKEFIEDVMESSSHEKFIQEWNGYFLLALIGALQLLPENHGKNVRLESFCLELLSKITDTRDKQVPPPHAIRDFLKDNLTFNHLEDPVEDFMTDRVSFQNSNYVVFPGILEEGAGILNGLLMSIFNSKNTVENKAKKEIYDGVMLMLVLGDLMARSTDLKSFVRAIDKDNSLYLPENSRTIDLIETVTFNKEEIKRISDAFGINQDAINSFVLSDFDGLTQIEDQNQNPIIERPLIKHEDNFIFISPSNQVSAILEFVYSKLKQAGKIEEVLELYHRRCWDNVQWLVQEHCDWVLTSLPERVQLSKQSPKLKSVWKFDQNKFCYLVYIDNTDTRQYWELDPSGDHFNSQINKTKNLIKSIEDDLEALRQFEEANADDFLVLIVLGNIGRNAFFAFDQIGKPNDQSLPFGYFNLINILYDPNRIDRLALWKFAKAYNEATSKTHFLNFSIIDAYAVYLKNKSSIFDPDDARPDTMLITSGTSSDFRMDSKEFRDEHIAKFYKDGKIRGVYVSRTASFARIYRANKLLKEYHLLVDDLGFPLWISVFSIKSIRHIGQINKYGEAISFWLTRLSLSLKRLITSDIQEPIHIILNLDEKLVQSNSDFEYKDKSEIEEPIDIEVRTKNEIVVSIGYDVIHLLNTRDNDGERLIMRRILEGLERVLVSSFSISSFVDQLPSLIDEHIPLGNAKMFLLFDVLTNPMIDNRWLPPSRFVQEYDVSVILDNLLVWSGEFDEIPEKIQSSKDKIRLCRKIVEGLYAQLKEALHNFKSLELLEILVKWNERCLHDKEFQSVQIPAKIACFSDIESEIISLEEMENSLVRTSLSIRCLIEMIVADPCYNGSKTINTDDLDRIVALMDEIISWGAFGDTIYFQLADPEMGKLPSGRLGTEKSFSNNVLKPFKKAQLETDLDEYIDDFTSNFRNDFFKNQETIKGDKKVDEEADIIDEAYQADYGVTFTEMAKVFRSLIEISDSQQSSYCREEEQELIEMILSIDSDLNKKVIKKILELFSLKNRGGIEKLPNGYDRNEIFPWVYNRRLSYIQKPLCQTIAPENSKTYYSWGFRHIITSHRNTIYLLRTGKMKPEPNASGAIMKIMGTFKESKGKSFTRKVRKWFKDQGDFQVVDYEVKIGPKGHLKHSEDLGDIDVCLFDYKSQTVYSIECKNTVKAKIIHEMKTEVDNYIGREGKKGMIDKHVRRHNWLNANKQRVASFIGEQECKKIISIVVTSEDIPVPYLVKEKLPLPFISFPKLQRTGIPFEKALIT